MPRTNLGKKEAKAVRKDSMVPAVLNGGRSVDFPYTGKLQDGEKCVPVGNGKGIIVTDFKISTDSIRKLIYSSDIFAIELKIGNKEVMAIIKDMQFHPVSEKVLHMDFLEISKEKPVVMTVPVMLEGHAEGVKSGGKLVLKMRRIKVKAIYTDIPEKLIVNIDSLALGKSISVGDINIDKLELISPKEAVVCSVLATRASVATVAVAK
ncbi:MAG: 50S ribosomal protein L25 [Bacteroidales bacterium]